jgi:hypothetical protein
MLQILAKLEQVIEGKAYSFLCDSAADLQHCKQALCAFIAHVQNVQDQTAAAAAAAAGSTPTSESSSQTSENSVALPQQVPESVPSEVEPTPSES